MRPKEIRAKQKEILAAQAKAMDEGDVTLANTLQGEYNAYTDLLDGAIEAEQTRADAARAITEKAKAGGTFLQQCFGGDVEKFRSEFVDGFKATMTFPSTPTVTDANLPVDGRPFAGVLDTLTHSTTNGIVEFFQLTTKENAADEWVSGDKPEGSLGWTPKSAPLVWIAEWMPVTRTAVSDYAQIDGIIRNELLLDLKDKKNFLVLQGSNSSGIVGILNTAGIQQYTKKAGDNIYDSIRRQITLSRVVGRVIPQYVALSPNVAENMDLLKNENGNYLRVNDGNRVWSLQIVEDEGMTVVDGATTKEGALVYAANCATWYTAENDAVEIGLVDKQFIQNAYTLRAESRNTLAVKRPRGFVYLPAAI